MNARCNVRLNDSGALISPCDINQPNATGGSNHAEVHVSIHDNDGSSQAATIHVSFMQSAVGNGNNGLVLDEAAVLHTNDGSVQTQDAHLSATGSQSAQAGSNRALVKQSVDENAIAQGSVQKQNGVQTADACANDDPFDKFFANVCLNLDQTTATGDNHAKLNQDIDLDALAQGPGPHEQKQGCNDCGIDGDVDQTITSGLGTSITDDDSEETQRAKGDPDADQTLNIDPKCCATQIGGVNNRAMIDLLAAQFASSPAAFLDARNIVTCNSPNGTCFTHSVIIQNGERDEVTMDGPFVNYIHDCASAGEEGGCFTEPVETDTDETTTGDGDGGGVG